MVGSLHHAAVRLVLFAVLLASASGCASTGGSGRSRSPADEIARVVVRAVVEALVAEIVGSAERSPPPAREPDPPAREVPRVALGYHGSLWLRSDPSLAAGPFVPKDVKSPETEALVKQLARCQPPGSPPITTAFAKLTVSSTGEVTAIQINPYTYERSHESMLVACWERHLTRVALPPSRQPTRTFEIFWIIGSV